MSELTRNSSTDDPKLELLNNSMAKSLFDSLNLQFDDGKPKFRLNEPSYSTVNIPYQNNLNCDDDDDETSFVVLDCNSKDDTNNTDMISKDDTDVKNKFTDMKSMMTSSFSLEQNNLSKTSGLKENDNASSIHINSIEFSLLNDFSTESLAKSFEAISLLQKEHSELKMKISDLESSMTSSLTLEQAGNSINQEKKNLSIENQNFSIENQNHCSNSHITDSANQNSKDFSLKELPKENSTDLEQMAKNKDRYERDMHYQQEIITSLKEQLRLLNENAFISLQLNPENNAIPEKSQDENYKKFFQHFNHYNEKLSILAKCYGEQTSHFINIQDYLKRCTDTCELLLDNIDSMNLSVETIGSCKEILENCRRSLVDEQIKNISYRQNLIKAQNEFQIIFSDYNSTLHELEILRDENMKPAEVKYNFEKEKNEITRNLKMLEDEKNQLSLERKNYMAERMILEQEKTNLSEEKSSINFQSMLYEAQMRTLQDDMKVLQKRHDEMLLENTKLKEELKMKNIEVEGVKARFEISKDDIDMIGHLRQQLELYESDFEEEKRTKQELIREREHLTDQLGKLRDHNQNLLQRLNGPNPAAVPQHSANGIPVIEIKLK
ncbi:Protein of unknown function [Cotesia congregata]|uniref:Uncharacterized protein n=1 Tax=Cotesia congregata TaxID=51543 RepID=A0A8J2HBR4_COTCN|nr:Protein of unknown function [Cotesia congregata]